MRVIGNLQILGDKSVIRLNPSPDTSSFSGFISDEYVGVDVTIGQALYYDSSIFRWKLAQANSITTMPCRGIALQTKSAESLCQILRWGSFSLDNWTLSGGFIYISDETAGLITSTAPTASGSIVQTIGNVLNSSIGYFDFNSLMVQLA